MNLIKYLQGTKFGGALQQLGETMVGNPMGSSSASAARSTTVKPREFNAQYVTIAVLIVVAFLFLLWCRKTWYNYKYNKDNPAFFKWSKDAKEQKTVPEKLFNLTEGKPQNYDVAYSFWFYLQDYKYRKKEWKHIFTDGQWDDTKSIPTSGPQTHKGTFAAFIP